jgi:DHA1 family bicyclomycin/chloramphenicol resistance-like MFS transporter
MAVPIADFIGGFVKDSVIPLFAGFLVCGMISLLLFYSNSNRVTKLLKQI